MSAILLFRVDGACTRKDPSATAFSLREPCWDFDVIAQWTGPDGADGHIDWARNSGQPSNRSAAACTSTTSTRTIRRRASARLTATNYERLAELKTKYDPTNFFRMNNNIPPG